MKQITWLMLSSSLILLMGSCQEKVKIFKIPEGQVGMFGFGSLMSKKTLLKQASWIRSMMVHFCQHTSAVTSDRGHLPGQRTYRQSRLMVLIPKIIFW